MCDDADDAQPNPDAISNNPQTANRFKPCLIQPFLSTLTIVSYIYDDHFVGLVDQVPKHPIPEA